MPVTSANSSSNKVVLLGLSLTFYRWLGLLFAFSLLVRVPVVITVAHDAEIAILASDSREYLALANNMLEYGTYSAEQDPPPLPIEHNRTPTYVIYLMPFVALWPASPLLPVVITQSFLGAIISVLTAMLGRQIFAAHVGLIAGWLASVSPMAVIMSGFIYTEILFAVLLLAGFVCLVEGLQDEKWPLSLLGGAFLGLATLTRPILLPILPIIGIGLLWFANRQKADRQKLLAGFVVGLLLLTPWMGRNLAQFGRFSLTTISDTNLYYYNAASLVGHLSDEGLEAARADLAIRLAGVDVSGDPWPAARERALAREIILDAPVAFAWYNGLDALNGFRPGFSFLLALTGQDASASEAIRTFTDGSIDDARKTVLQQGGLLIALQSYMMVYIIVLLGSTIVGIVLLLMERQWPILLLCIGTSAALLYLPGIASNARFRMPVEPLLAIVSAYVVWIIVGKIGSRKHHFDRSKATH